MPDVSDASDIVGVSRETVQGYTAAKRSGRLCRDNFDTLRKHLNSMQQKSNPSMCNVCGKPCYWKCMECVPPTAVHVLSSKGKFEGCGCFMDLHNDHFYGLARCDSSAKLRWLPPDEHDKRMQATKIKRIMTRLESNN